MGGCDAILEPLGARAPAEALAAIARPAVKSKAKAALQTLTSSSVEGKGGRSASPAHVDTIHIFLSRRQPTHTPT